MRNIKFRFYDKENKTMNYCDLEDLCEDDYWFDSETEVWTALHDSNNEQEKFVAMQYTGLKDENGKEVYEGDIIEFSYDIFTGNFDTKVGKGIVEFIFGAFYIKPYEIEGEKIKDIENEEWFLLYSVNEDDLEVIGNIYNNPELLEEGE